MHKPTSVLFVCHANVCRSPMAERLAELALARRLDARSHGGGPSGDSQPEIDDIVFASAGTHAYPGESMHHHTLPVLTEYGASTRAFASRRVDAALIDDADLILTASREQRAHCVQLSPAAIRRTFTIREFGRLCGAVSPGAIDPTLPYAARLTALVEATSVARAEFQPLPAREDELPDPIGQPLAEFQTCGHEIWSALEAIMGLVTPGRIVAGRRR